MGRARLSACKTAIESLWMRCVAELQARRAVSMLSRLISIEKKSPCWSPRKPIEHECTLAVALPVAWNAHTARLQHQQVTTRCQSWSIEQHREGIGALAQSRPEMSAELLREGHLHREYLAG